MANDELGNAITPIVLILSFFFQLPIYILTIIALLSYLSGVSSNSFNSLVESLADKGLVTFIYSSLFVLLSGYMIFLKEPDLKESKKKRKSRKQTNLLRQLFKYLTNIKTYFLGNKEFLLKKSFLITLFLALLLLFAVSFMEGGRLKLNADSKNHTITLLTNYITNLLVLYFLGHGLTPRGTKIASDADAKN